MCGCDVGGSTTNEDVLRKNRRGSISSFAPYSTINVVFLPSMRLFLFLKTPPPPQIYSLKEEVEAPSLLLLLLELLLEYLFLLFFLSRNPP